MQFTKLKRSFCWRMPLNFPSYLLVITFRQWETGMRLNKYNVNFLWYALSGRGRASCCLHSGKNFTWSHFSWKVFKSLLKSFSRVLPECRLGILRWYTDRKFGLWVKSVSRALKAEWNFYLLIVFALWNNFVSIRKLLAIIQSLAWSDCNKWMNLAP